MARLEARVRRRDTLTEAEVTRMHAIYASYYDATSRALFADDLAGKSHVIELAADGEVCGFSTLALLPFEHRGVPNLALFSGDTIIDQAHWGDQALVAAFCRFAGTLKARDTARPLFWFLISKGYRTYRYLSLFAHRYYPSHAGPTPVPMRERLEALGRQKFGTAFDAASGVIRFAESHGHLKPQWADVRPQLLVHPVVRYFLDCNPGYAHGDELACLTELDAGNLRSFARRAFVEGLDANADRVVAS
jgi:hypothetical protein